MPYKKTTKKKSLQKKAWITGQYFFVSMLYENHQHRKQLLSATTAELQWVKLRLGTATQHQNMI